MMELMGNLKEDHRDVSAVKDLCSVGQALSPQIWRGLQIMFK